MQFKVPQNIDLEDKIVGPLTLLQFVYCLVGSLLCYVIYQLLMNSLGLVILIDLPIALITLGLAFLKIQDQPVIHFVTAGIQYFLKPKTRYWKREGQNRVVIYQAPVVVKKDAGPVAKKKIEKSDLEKLAYMLDTRPMAKEEQEKFGRITQNFEKILKDSVGSKEYNQIVNNGQGNGQNVGQGGNSGTVGQKQSPSR